MHFSGLGLFLYPRWGNFLAADAVRDVHQLRNLPREISPIAHTENLGTLLNSHPGVEIMRSSSKYSVAECFPMLGTVKALVTVFSVYMRSLLAMP